MSDKDELKKSIIFYIVYIIMILFGIFKNIPGLTVVGAFFFIMFTFCTIAEFICNGKNKGNNKDETSM